MHTHDRRKSIGKKETKKKKEDKGKERKDKRAKKRKRKGKKRTDVVYLLRYSIAVCCIQYFRGNVWYCDEIQKSDIFVLIRFFFPSEISTPAVRADSSSYDKIDTKYVVTNCCETVIVNQCNRYLFFIVSVHAFVSNSCVQPSQPSPSQPRPSGPRCCGFCLPTRCPASPLPTLHLLRSPLWRCCPFAWQARKTGDKKKGKREIS